MPGRHVFDVVGIGNALVDVIVHGEDDFLERNGLVKGSMTLIDTDRAVELYQAIGSGVEMSGGSAANTMCGVASFGGRGGYIGKVADDDLGTLFGHDLRGWAWRFAVRSRATRSRPGAASSWSRPTPNAR